MDGAERFAQVAIAATCVTCRGERSSVAAIVGWLAYSYCRYRRANAAGGKRKNLGRRHGSQLAPRRRDTHATGAAPGRPQRAATAAS